METNPYQSPALTGEGREQGIQPTAPLRWVAVLLAALLVGLILFDPNLGFLASMALGWLASRTWRNAATVVAAGIGTAYLAALLVLLATGIGMQLETLRVAHRWFAHGAVIFLWLGIPLVIGVVAQRKLRRLPISTLGVCAFLLLNLAAAFAASFTGYLGPLRNPLLADETRWRFFLLHQVVLPALLFAFVVLWWRALRPSHRERAENV